MTYSFGYLGKATQFIEGNLEGYWPCQGKCDLRDHLCMLSSGDTQTVEEHAKKFIDTTTISVGEFILKSDTIQDVAPYMFHLISVGSFSKEGKSSISLTKRPYLDIAEFDHLMLYAERIFKYFRWCKNKKALPSIDHFFEWNKEWEPIDNHKLTYATMFDRYMEHNYKKNKDLPKYSKEDLCQDIHTACQNLHREELVDFCIGIGCDKKHPMLLKYMSDIYWFYALINKVIDKSYDERHEFSVQFQELIEKRGWV